MGIPDRSLFHISIHHQVFGSDFLTFASKNSNTNSSKLVLISFVETEEKCIRNHEFLIEIIT